MDHAALAGIGMLLAWAGGLIAGMAIRESYWRAEAVTHGYAHYHPETGKFTWGRANQGETG